MEIINIIINFFIAVGTIGAVIVALFLFRKESKESRERRIDEEFNKIRDNAFKVDTWIVVDCKKQFTEQCSSQDATDTYEYDSYIVVVQNDSIGIIHDVFFELKWYDQNMKICHNKRIPIASGTQKNWQTISRGTWLIAMKYWKCENPENKTYGSWCFPQYATESELQKYQPQFCSCDEGDTKHEYLKHEVVSFVFTDIHGNTWRRSYNGTFEERLRLIDTPRNDFKKYIEK